MPIFNDCLNESSRYIWDIIAGKPKRDPRPSIEVKGKLETLEEIDQLMRQLPASKKELNDID